MVQFDEMGDTSMCWRCVYRVVFKYWRNRPCREQCKHVRRRPWHAQLCTSAMDATRYVKLQRINNYGVVITRALLRLERTMNLLEGGKGGEGRMGERGWGGDGGRVGREGGEGTWGREGGWGEREGEGEIGRMGREGGWGEREGEEGGWGGEGRGGRGGEGRGGEGRGGEGWRLYIL